LRLQNELRGIPCLDLETPSDKKNIATTRSFDRNYSKYEEVRERVATFTATCAEKLRVQKSCANAIMVFIHTNSHRKDLPQYARNYLLKLPYPTNSSIELAKFATFALEKIFRKGFEYKKAGVIVMDFTPEKEGQIMLFENSDARHQLVMDKMDSINKAIGRSKVKLASQDAGRTWKMRQEKLSPRYSTRIEEAIKIKMG
jgi:DNA polymerase V